MSRRTYTSFASAVLGSLLALHCTPDSGSDDGGGAGASASGGASGVGPSIGGSLGVNAGGLGGDLFGGSGGTAGTSGGAGGAPDVAGCGDGIVQVGEACDDGNSDASDGCAADCSALDADFACPTPGEACVSTVQCGDGHITGAELCDDANHIDGDGCSANCATVEPGWTCLTPGLRCQATGCGDGVVAGFEECDFGADIPGCTSCRVDAGYDCSTLGSVCEVTVCGNGVVERGEQCEDDDDVPFDGCFDCRREPVCVNGVCQSVCGDGQRFEDEGCDDGNTRSGDGCSATCTVEVGYGCTPLTGTPPATVELPIIYRDFIGQGNSLRDTDDCYNPVTGAPSPSQPEPCFHIDFNGLGGDGFDGVVESDLGSNGRPVYSCPGDDCDANPGHVFERQGEDTRPNFNGPVPFAEWYESSSPNARTILSSLDLDRDEDDGTYVFNASGSFYPLDGKGWVSLEQEAVASNDCAHNVSFTSETHFWFEYQGGESFEFIGDDDLWVFVNRKLAIDLGGLHVSQTGRFVLDADTDDDGPDTADGTASVTDRSAAHAIDFGMHVGGVYEIVLFHAERNECGSNFKVTLKDFNKPKSVCVSTCGDGVVASNELCDDGADGNDGGYGRCGHDCLSRGPYCGDATVQDGENEECDDGLNLTGYGNGCAPGCKTPARCGDSVVNAVFGEECDDGVNDGSYGGCTSECLRAEHCGDGAKQEGEECDDSNLLSGDGCSAGCRLEDPR